MKQRHENPDDILHRIGFNVTRRRWELGITPGELAARCHWRRANIDRIEQARFDPLMLEHVEILAIALCCTEKDLCEKREYGERHRSCPATPRVVRWARKTQSNRTVKRHVRR